jgi:hypothetical protein
MMKMFDSSKVLLLTLLFVISLSGSTSAAPVQGDLSANGIVGLEDLKLLCDYWLDAGCVAPGCEADLGGAAGVNMDDFELLARNFGKVRVIDRADYADRLRALWLGECIANWTGIQTEGHRSSPPFYDDSDWGPGGFDFVLDQDPWWADDDTDIEYVYCHLMDQHGTHMLSGQQIRDGWMSHINSYIWVSDERARSLMNDGHTTPQTGMLALNDLALMIDAQLTTEIFGVYAPGMPDMAMKVANLPIRLVATGYAAHAAQYFMLLYCLASDVDTSLSRKDQVLWLADEARMYIPDTSKSADIYDFVKADYLANSNKDDWESTRDKIYDRYQDNAASNGFRYQTWYESSVNFAAGIMALLYGEGDYKKTVKIGTLSGWDSDNSTATLGGLLGFMYGYSDLVAEFVGTSFSDRYWIDRTRDNMPDYLPGDSGAEDTLTMLANRMLGIIDIAIEDAGGTVDANSNEWLLPVASSATALEQNPLYIEMQQSANNKVRDLGGTVTPAASVPVSSDIDKMADGFEHNFEGDEWWPSGDPWYYSTQRGGNHSGEIQTLSVTYDRQVDVSIIRYIEGADGSGGGWFTSADVEVEVNSVWQTPPGSVTASEPLNSSQDYQIIDYVLSAPVRATGIRITGPVGGKKGYVTALELDAMSAPPTGSAPYVSITSPSNGASFDEGNTITIDVYAADADGSVTLVEFFDGAAKLGEDSNSPYSYDWVGASLGSHSLKARATDNDSKTTTSATVNISVNPVGVAGLWRSFDVIMQSGSPQATVTDGNGITADLEFYESTDNDGVNKGSLFSTYTDGTHADGFNHAEHIWAPTSGYDAYPYAAKSTVARGSDSGEANTPAPSGVFDLQLHPPDNDHLTVAAFIVPFAGDYSVYDLGVRRVWWEGSLAGYRVFDESKSLLTHIVATTDQDWVTDPNTYNLGTLTAGDRIYFAVDREDDYFWDATEIIWTIEKN